MLRLQTVDEERLVVFVDVVDSLGLYRRLGDRDAHAMIDEALTTLEGQIGSRNGEVIKRIGDGSLSLFADVGDGVLMLGEAQRCADLALRIGAHWGVVLRRQNDVFGDTVNRAARLAGLARGREVLLSEEVTDRLVEPLRARCRPVERVRLKGHDAVESLYQYGWEGSNATRVNTAISITAARIRGDLRLDTSAGPVHLPSGETYVIGRDESCDLVLDDTRVSRFHATLEWRRGRCVLCDHSTNGSFLHGSEQTRAVLVRREDVPLAGAGRISFAADDPRLVVDFCYE